MISNLPWNASNLCSYWASRVFLFNDPTFLRNTSQSERSRRIHLIMNIFKHGRCTFSRGLTKQESLGSTTSTAILEVNVPSFWSIIPSGMLMTYKGVVLATSKWGDFRACQCRRRAHVDCNVSNRAVMSIGHPGEQEKISIHISCILIYVGPESQSGSSKRWSKRRGNKKSVSDMPGSYTLAETMGLHTIFLMLLFNDVELGRIIRIPTPWGY